MTNIIKFYDKARALRIAQQMVRMSEEIEASMKALDYANNQIRGIWNSDEQKAYEESLDKMKAQLNTYTTLLQEYGTTLTKVANGTHNTEMEYAKNIRARFET